MGKDNSPKTSESQSKGKSPGMKPNKKRKLNETNYKERFTITVTFPKGPLPVEEILPLFEDCKDVFFTQKRRVEFGYDSYEGLDERAEKLRKINISGIPLLVYVRQSNASLLKKSLYLESDKYQEEARKFFNAKSIDYIIDHRGSTSKFHVLTFETEEEAEAAASKPFVVNEESFTLRPYFKPSGRVKEKVKQPSTVTNKKECFTVNITFPKGRLLLEEILPIFEDCTDVIFTLERKVELGYHSSENLEERAEKLKKLIVNGEPLTAYVRDSKLSLVKKSLYLESAEYQEEARKFFNAKSIDSTKNRRGVPTRFHVLTFETEEEAEAASSKQFVVNEESFSLRPYFEPYGKKKKKRKYAKKGEAKQEKQQQNPKPEHLKRKAEDSEDDDDDDDDEEEELDGDDSMDIMK